jgi:hypothetical protein
MARLKPDGVDKFYNTTIDSFWLSNVYLVQYPYQSNLNFIALSYSELGKELKKFNGTYTPVVFDVQTFGKPKIKKLPLKTVKDLINK